MRVGVKILPGAIPNRTERTVYGMVLKNSIILYGIPLQGAEGESI